MSLFTGLSAFPITPQDEHGRIQVQGLARLLERIKAAGADSVGLLGSTGTYVYLTREERRRAVEVARKVLRGEVPLIVGIGALRTDEVEMLAQDAEAAGADALLLAPVSYTPLTEEEVYQHFLAVAGVTNLPICIYNNPGTTHFSFSEALIARLAALPLVQAVKMPLAKDGAFKDEIARLRAGAPAGFAVGYSGDWGCPAALLAGADAWYSVIGGLFPVQTLKLARAAQSRDAAEVARLEAAFEGFWSLFKQYGGLRVVYSAARLMGLTDALPPRPILPCPDSEAPRIEAAIEALLA